MITQKIFRYSFDRLEFKPFDKDFTPVNGFAVKFRLKAPVTEKERTTLFEIPDTLKISTRILNKSADENKLNHYERGEHYFSYCDENGNVPVLEAEILMDYKGHPERKNMQIGVPLTIYNAVDNDVVLVYNGQHFRFFINGEVINENLPVGVPQFTTTENSCLNNDAFAIFETAVNVSDITRSVYEKKLDKSINYYSPAGYNAWAGDVVNFWHDGVYHLIYFIDRHHHGNRWGGGAHHFQHITTTDFINWVDHGPLFELETQWQSVGTGTMFFHNGKFYFSFGFHTSRVIDSDKLYAPELIKAYEKDKEVVPVSYDEIFASGKYPNGSNYAVSEDGFNFVNGHRMYHWAENPSVYTADDNTLLMYCGGGVWQASEIDKPWKLIKQGFPPCGKNSPMRNTEECPSFFEWNGCKYLIMGVTGYWRTDKDSDDYIDSAAQGYDIYDGLVVPMAVSAGGNRVIYAGWMNGIGWGSIIVHRELIQYDDGRLGMKWLDELAPSRDELLFSDDAPDTESFCYDTEPDKSYYYEMTVDPASGEYLAVQFDSECELRLDFKREIAQFGNVNGDSILPAHEAVKTLPQDNYNPWTFGDLHAGSRNFAIANVDVMKEPFTLKVVQHFSRKMNAVIIDAEINGQRTLVTNRVNVKIQKIALTAKGEGVKVTNLKIFKGDEE